MKNFEFNFNRIKTNIRSSRQISLTIFCAILISVFILTWASSTILATINYRSYLNQISYDPDEIYARLSYSRNYSTENKLTADFVQKAMAYEFDNDYNFAMSTGTNIAINGHIMNLQIAGLGDNFIDDTFVVLDGDINKIYSEDAIALIESLVNKLNLFVGDTVNINGKDFELCAIVDEYKCFDYIFMSIENYEDLFANVSMALHLYIKNLSQGDISSLTHKLDRIFKAPNLSNISVEEYKGRNELLDYYVENAVSKDIIPIIIIFILSIISLVVLYFGLIKWRKRNIGIHLSLGASPRDISLDSTLEILGYMLVSTLISFIAINIFYNQLSYMTSILINKWLYIFVLAINILLALVIGALAARKITSEPINEMIGG